MANSAAGLLACERETDPRIAAERAAEALDSGAFWFYRKLGFRAVAPEAAKLVDREERRMLQTSGHRSSKRTLERLAKEGGIKGLAPFFPRVVKAYLIGEAAEQFAETLGDRVRHQMCGTLQNAVSAAAADAADDTRGDAVVLLSPACASYDQFQNFERRGDAFRLLVRQINGVTSQGRAA